MNKQKTHIIISADIKKGRTYFTIIKPCKRDSQSTSSNERGMRHDRSLPLVLFNVVLELAGVVRERNLKDANKKRNQTDPIPDDIINKRSQNSMRNF